MTPHYLIGVACGIIGGLLNQGGQLLQKKVVNDIRQDDPGQGFMRRLLRNPLWVFGFVVGLGGGTAGYMLAQSLIGPALSPGLMASGLILLSIGSVRLNHEELNKSEITGIVLMVIGILCLGLSELSISATQVRSMLADHSAQIRVIIFTACLFSCCLVSRSLALRRQNRKGLLIVLGNGFLACLSDFWINPLLALIILVMAGKATDFQTFFFIMAAVILAFTASVITWQNQIAFKYAQASNVIPVAQVPIQICPVLVYFFIFALTPPRTISIFFILTGTILTIIAGFLLGRRPEISLTKNKLPEQKINSQSLF
ncbi:MAG: DMT family transporter [Anaerolineales bacterium]|jgi:drug/metabolite transporter (DMT)-like permease